MPLNHERGETLGDLGSYVVVSVEKWDATPLFSEAATKAAKVFAKAGALLPITFGEREVLVQEYHRPAPQMSTLAFIFLKRIAGREEYYPYIYELDGKAVGELTSMGLWSSNTVH